MIEQKKMDAELRQIVTDALVSMVSGVTGLVPPSGPGAIPDFIQAPIDRAVEKISASLPVGVPGQGEGRGAVMGRVHHNLEHAEPVRAVLNSIGRQLPDNAPLYADPQPAHDVRGLVEALDDACEEFELRGLHGLKAYKNLKQHHADLAHRQAQRKGERHDT